MSSSKCLTKFCFSVQLTSQDKTPAVISRAMAKHNLEGEEAADYELVQVISDERGITLNSFSSTFKIQVKV